MLVSLSRPCKQRNHSRTSIDATDKLQNRPTFNASPSDVVCQWQRDKRELQVRSCTRAHMRNTRARVTGNCESQFATAGIRKARSWIQPRGCVELIGCGGELGHRRFTIAIGSVAFCIACRVREVSDIGDFNCARKIGLWHVRATNASDWSLFELKITKMKCARENKRFYERTRMGSLMFLF